MVLGTMASVIPDPGWELASEAYHSRYLAERMNDPENTLLDDLSYRLMLESLKENYDFMEAKALGEEVDSYKFEGSKRINLLTLRNFYTYLHQDLISRGKEKTARDVRKAMVNLDRYLEEPGWPFPAESNVDTTEVRVLHDRILDAVELARTLSSETRSTPEEFHEKTHAARLILVAGIRSLEEFSATEEAESLNLELQSLLEPRTASQ